MTMKNPIPALLCLLTALCGPPGCGLAPALAQTPVLAPTAAQVTGGDPQGRITQVRVSPAATQYGEADAAFEMSTVAANDQIFYDPVSPAYAANLFPDEDNRRGVSADILLYRPGQSVLTAPLVQPAYHDYDGTGGLTNLLGAGVPAWLAHWCPDRPGVWTEYVREYDPQGVAVEGPYTTTVTASTSHGFIKVSPSDSRYFEYSDGTAFLAAGSNGTRGGQVAAAITAAAIQQAVCVHRLWVSGNGGIEVVGGGGNYQGETFHGVSYNPENDLPIAGLGDPAGGPCGVGTRFAMKVATQFQVYTGGLLPGRAYTLRTNVRLTSTAGLDTPGPHGAGPTLVLYPLGSAALQDTTAWQAVAIHVAASHGPVNNCNLGCNGTATQFTPCLLDGWTITDDLTGKAVLDGVGTNWLTRYDQQAAASLDSTLLSCSTNPLALQYLNLCLWQHEDSEWGQVNPDGTGSATPQGPNAVGGSFTPDTPVKRFQSDFIRYVMARWGWSPQVMGLECWNEGDPSSGIYASGAENVALAAHALSSTHRMLVSTSGWWQTGGPNLPTYTDSAGRGVAPDLDYCEEHAYPQTTVSPYNFYQPHYPRGGSVVSPTGGPNGGYISVLNSQNTLPFIGLAAGTYTWQWQYKTSPDYLAGNSQYPDPNWYAAGGGEPYSGSRSGYINHVGSKPVATWTPEGYSYPELGGVNYGLQLVAGNIVGGAEYFGPIALLAPDGLPALKITWSEPPLGDGAAFGEYLGLGAGETYSGDTGGSGLPSPLVVGEAELENDSGNSPYSTVGGQPYDATGVFDQTSAFGDLCSSSPSLIQYWYDETVHADAANGWQPWGLAERMLSDCDFAGGRWRNADPTVSAGLVAVGQAAPSENRAELYVYNSQYTWQAVAGKTPVTPVSGTVVLHGFTAGQRYLVVHRSCTTGLQTGIQDTACSPSGTLTISESGLTSNDFVEVYVIPGYRTATAAGSGQAYPGQGYSPPASAVVLASAFVGTQAAPSPASYSADGGYSGGGTYSTSAAVTTQAGDDCPAAAYQHERFGNFSYVIGGMLPGVGYTLRLHFAEIYWSGAGQRLFNVSVNGTQVLNNFDVYAAAGGKNRAVVETFPVAADPAGDILLRLIPYRGQAELNAVEITS